MRTGTRRLFYLDVIRALSAVLIVVYHFSGSVYLSGRWSGVDVLHATINGSWGMTPVYCFFMVSGAALMHRYPAGERLDIRKFYQKRFVSIYPLFWIAYVLGFFSVFWRLGHLYDLPSWCLLWSFIGLDGWVVNWFPTFYMVGEWFLGSIILLYLIFPLVHRAWQRNKHLTMAICAAACAGLFWYHPFPMDIKQNPVVDLFYFLLGAWIEEVRSRYFHRPWAGPSVWVMSLAVLGVWLLFPVTNGLPSMELTYSAQAYGMGMFLRQGFILVCTVSFYLFFMGITVWMEGGKDGNVRLPRLRNLILEISGKSYGIFLTHHVVSQLICLHFDLANLSKREILTVLAMVFAATWVMTLVIYRIWQCIKKQF